MMGMAPRKMIAFLAIAAIPLLLSGCVMRSPLLLYKTDKSAGIAALSKKAGLENVAFNGNGSFTPSITTMALPIPFYIFTAKYPRLEEKNYMTDAVYQYFQDTPKFSYVYSAPYDTKDVEYVLDFKVDKLLMKNNSVYSSLLTLPVINFLVFILPQERFAGEIALEMTVKKPSGEVVATFKHAAKRDSDWVWIYSQPYADYLWYHSLFKKQFLGLMDQFAADLDTLKKS